MNDWKRPRGSESKAHGATCGSAGRHADTGPERDGPLTVAFVLGGRGTPIVERWLASLPAETRFWIDDKIRRLAQSRRALLRGTEPLGGGLRELRHLGKGPGYRVYMTLLGDRLIILGGGDKSRQPKDVKDARRRLRGLHHSESGHA